MRRFEPIGLPANSPRAQAHITAELKRAIEKRRKRIHAKLTLLQIQKALQ